MSNSKPIVALDIGPMGERFHTGIANVTKYLAIELIGDGEVDCMFTLNRQTLPPRVVEKLVTMNSGNILEWVAGRTRSLALPPDVLDRPVIGIFPGHKWHRRFFPFEVQIVHDLTPILLPQFHTRDTVEFWQGALFGDMASSDLIAPVSDSTASDIRTYFPELAHIPVVVSKLAPCCEEITVTESGAQPYFVVVGTLEPRKNITSFLEFLSTNPAIFQRASFVFVGRVGWGEPIEPVLKRLKLDKYRQDGHLRFTGFISDRTRDTLVAHSSGVIYPSIYEGFGLPVIEALAQGVPVVTTTSSSLPEAGGDHARYCDFTDPADIGTSIDTLLAKKTPEQIVSEREARKAWARSFTWRDTYRRIRDAAFAQHDVKHPRGPQIGRTMSLVNETTN